MIRRATTADHDWIAQLSTDVYGVLGDYSAIIPAWLAQVEVLSYVDEQDERQGFIVLGFYKVTEDQHECCVADLLAIAVAPPFQRQGVGRRLLRFAIGIARAAASRNNVAELRLTVPEDNAVGMKLYTSSGFEVLNEEHGEYDGGQRAIRMTKRL